jgi:hypothetical protein
MEESNRQGIIADSVLDDEDYSRSRSWTVDEVCRWLSRKGFSNLTETFRLHDISGAELLKLDGNDFAELGIAQLGVKKRLQEAIYVLKSHTAQVMARGSKN